MSVVPITTAKIGYKPFTRRQVLSVQEQLWTLKEEYASQRALIKDLQKQINQLKILLVLTIPISVSLSVLIVKLF